jgi:hypothetical protein
VITKADLAVRLVKAEMLLRRLREHRVAAALDRGGDQTPLDMLYTIERFIDGYFAGTYWPSGARVYPYIGEVELFALCEEAQGPSGHPRRKR